MQALRALDPDQKGYFDYRAFAKKLTPGVGERMALLGGASEDVRLPDVGPSKTYIADNIRKAANVQQTVRDVRQTFNPDYDTSNRIEP